MAVTAQAKRHVRKLLGALEHAYPEAECSLDFHNPLELLVATVLSAQCTDERVNLVTKKLFRRYRSAADYAQARQRELERDIQSTGFFRNKAKNLRACCRELVDRFDGRVPQEMDSLVALPGIGRKTANVILGTAFAKASGVVVDTHVGRISRRLGLSQHKEPVKVEQDLIGQLPEEEWIGFSHRIIQHGRRVCTARRPKCDDCPLADLCPRIGLDTS